MKRIIITAGALLLGTSAFAWAPSSVPVAQDIKAPLAASEGKAPAATLVAKSNDLPKVASDSDDLATASADKGDKLVTADADLDLAISPDSLDKGIGGPLEEVDAPAATTSTTAGYPPCRPGPGDDHCIQLYEPGVRAALASWNPPADTVLAAEMGESPAEATGVGGPYEPVDTASVMPMEGDGVIDAQSGETADAFASSTSE
jgi:hypothetical protein